jgi:hypothetical protein
LGYTHIFAIYRVISADGGLVFTEETEDTEETEEDPFLAYTQDEVRFYDLIHPILGLRPNSRPAISDIRTTS